MKWKNPRSSGKTLGVAPLPRYLHSTWFNSKQQDAHYHNLKWTMSLLRSKDQQQKNPLPSSATRWSISELQAHYGMTPGPWTWSVSVLPANKLSLQELNH